MIIFPQQDGNFSFLRCKICSSHDLFPTFWRNLLSAPLATPQTLWRSKRYCCGSKKGVAQSKPMYVGISLKLVKLLCSPRSVPTCCLSTWSCRHKTRRLSRWCSITSKWVCSHFYYWFVFYLSTKISFF